MFFLDERRAGVLPLESTQKLRELQRELASCNAADRAALVATLWSNRTENKAFTLIIDRLKVMAWGCVRCCYCEDSCANAIEHIWPKSLYPHRCFVWKNFAYVCGICNGKKLSKFAFIDKTSLQKTIIKKDIPFRHPPLGTSYPMFLDTRQEDPFHTLWLDLETFLFKPIEGIDNLQRERAQYTIDALGLNSRSELKDAREQAYETYIDRIIGYIEKRDDPQKNITTLLEKYRRAIARSPHRTVWLEMKRQHARIGGELAQLFARAPEALDW
jgi:hypothetical protein